MLLSLALSTLACAPAAAPGTSVVHAGFLRDARVELLSGQRLSFEARLSQPATITRRSFLVEGFAADGALLGSRSVTARTEAPPGRQRGSVEARFEIELPALAGVERWLVRCAP